MKRYEWYGNIAIHYVGHKDPNPGWSEARVVYAATQEEAENIMRNSVPLTMHVDITHIHRGREVKEDATGSGPLWISPYLTLKVPGVKE